MAAAEALEPDEVQRQTGLSRQEIEDFYALFAANSKVVTVYSQGVNQSSMGTDKVSAILNAHLATGRIGKSGQGPFSVTGQPNAMGGREVGGLANVLAGHLNIEDPEHRDLVQAFWQSPTMAEKPGLKAVDLFRHIETGAVKAVWIMATNPAVSVPEAQAIEAALAKCPLVVVSDALEMTRVLDEPTTVKIDLADPKAITLRDIEALQAADRVCGGVSIPEEIRSFVRREATWNTSENGCSACPHSADFKCVKIRPKAQAA